MADPGSYVCPDPPWKHGQRARVEVVRVVGAQHDRAVAAQLVDQVEGRGRGIAAVRGGASGRHGGRSGAAWLAVQQRPEAGERVGAPARLTRHAEDLGRPGRNGLGDLPGQEGLADARRALDDDADPRGRPPLDHGED